MQTMPVPAHTIEEGDVITLGGESVFRVAYANDETTSVSFVLEDEDGEIDRENPVSFTAFENVNLVYSLDEETDLSWLDTDPDEG